MTQWPWMVPPILSDGSIEPTMGMPAPAPGAPPGIFERLSGVFGGQQGLLNLGANLMSASGPSQQPVSFGSALGNAIAANQQFQRQNQTDMLQQMLLKTKLQKKSKLQDEYEYAKSQGFKGSIEDWKKIAQQPSAGPASIQEYNLYTEQEKASGRTPMEFDPWLQRRSQLNVGAPYMLGEVAGQRGPFSRVTGEFTPTSTLPQETDAAARIKEAEARAAELAKAQAGRDATFHEDLNVLDDEILRTQRLISEFKSGKYQTGPLAGKLPNFRTAAQDLQREQGKDVIKAISSATFGALSEGEREFLRNLGLSESATEESNINMLEQRLALLTKTKQRLQTRSRLGIGPNAEDSQPIDVGQSTVINGVKVRRVK